MGPCTALGPARCRLCGLSSHKLATPNLKGRGFRVKALSPQPHKGFDSASMKHPWGGFLIISIFNISYITVNRPIPPKKTNLSSTKYWYCMGKL